MNAPVFTASPRFSVARARTSSARAWCGTPDEEQIGNPTFGAALAHVRAHQQVDHLGVPGKHLDAKAPDAARLDFRVKQHTLVKRRISREA